MPFETAMAMTFLIGLTFWKAIMHVAEQRQGRMQREVAMRGALCQGRVIAIQRPFLFEASTRLYFEFVPLGAETPLHCCHVYRNHGDDLAALPSAGTAVTVRYLPDRPEHAVIGRLVARMVGAAAV
jgi:hypothetical protein